MRDGIRDVGFQESQSPSHRTGSCQLSGLSLGSCSSPRACHRGHACSPGARLTGTLRAGGLQPSSPPLCPEERTALLPQGLCTSCSYRLSCRGREEATARLPPELWQLGVQGETPSEAMIGRCHPIRPGLVAVLPEAGLRTQQALGPLGRRAGPGSLLPGTAQPRVEAGPAASSLVSLLAAAHRRDYLPRCCLCLRLKPTDPSELPPPISSTALLVPASGV